MVRLAPCVRRRAFHHVETRHLLFELRISSRSKLPGVQHESGISARKKVVVQRQNDVSLVEVVVGIDILSKRHLSASANVIATYWVVLYPLGLRILLHQRIQLIG